MKYSLLLTFSLITFSLTAQITLVQELNAGIGNTSCACDLTTFGQDCAIELDETTTLIKLRTSDTNWELYKLSSSGIDLVKDINPGDADSEIEQMTYYKGKIYFVATDGSGHKIWESDGTSDGTKVAFDFGKDGLSYFEINAFITGADGNLYFEYDKVLYSFDGADLLEFAHTSEVKVPRFSNGNSKAWCTYNNGMAVMNHNGTNWELLEVDGSGVKVLANLAVTDDGDTPYGMAEFEGGLVFSFEESSNPDQQGTLAYYEDINEVKVISTTPAYRVSAINERSCLLHINSNYVLFDGSATEGRTIISGSLQLVAGEQWGTSDLIGNVLFHSNTGFFQKDIFSFYNATTGQAREIYTADREAFPMTQIGSYGFFAATKGGSFDEYGMYSINLHNGQLQEVVDLGDPDSFNLFYKAITIIDGELYFFGSVDSDSGIEIYKTAIGLDTDVEDLVYDNDLKLFPLSDDSYMISYPTHQDIQLNVFDLAGQLISSNKTSTNTAFSIPSNGLYIIQVEGAKGINTFKAFSR